MAQTTKTFKSKKGLEAYLEIETSDILDKELPIFYEIHGKQQLGVQLTKKELQLKEKLVEKSHPKLFISDGKNKILLDISMEEVFSLQNFLNSSLSEVFSLKQITFETIVSNNNLFNRISDAEKVAIDSKLHEKLSTEK